MSSSSSYFINRQTAEQAIRMSLPLIQEAMKQHEVGESGFLHLVVMDPVRTPARSSFEEAVLYEYSIGDRSQWDADYAEFARAKARIAWRTGMDSHAIQELRPHMLMEGDTLLWGSVAMNGIVVGVSGAHPWYDEAFAGIVAMCLRALAKAAATMAERKENLFLSEK